MADRDWPVLIAPNRHHGENWKRHLWNQGITIKGVDIYTLDQTRKFEGARFTKVYLAPGLEQAHSIRGMIERVQALDVLHRACIKGGDRFEGYFIISPPGQIFGPQRTL